LEEWAVSTTQKREKRGKSLWFYFILFIFFLVVMVLNYSKATSLLMKQIVFYIGTQMSVLSKIIIKMHCKSMCSLVG